jgi:hypothetical protein
MDTILARLDTDLRDIASYIMSANRLLKAVAANPTLMAEWQWSRGRTHLRIAASLVAKARDRARPGARGPALVRKRVSKACSVFDVIEAEVAALPPGRAKRDSAAAAVQLAATRACVAAMLRSLAAKTKRRAR